MSPTNREPSPDPDVCVIGSGPAGAFVAYTLAERGRDVLILEAGPTFDLEDRSRVAEQLERAIRPEYSIGDVWEMSEERDAYRADVPDGVAFDLNDRRVKAVGGTSLALHGTVMRLHESDFEMAERYGIGADWPLSYADLAPYYQLAEAELGVAGEPGPHSPPREMPFPMPAFPASHTDELYIEACEELDIAVQAIPHARNSEPYDGRDVCEGYGTCTPFCPSLARYTATVHLDRARAAGVRLIDRAIVEELEHDERGTRVDAAIYRTPDGTRYRQPADQFVLACGPVETPRLLLLSDSHVYPEGLANTSGAVGQYFQATPYISTTARMSAPTQPWQAGFDTSMSYEFYEPERDDLASIWLVFRNENPTPMIERILQGGAGHARDRLLTEVRGNPWGDALVERVREADPAGFSNLRISSYVEQRPRAANRVTLDESTTDQFGNPVPSVSVSFDDRIERTQKRALEIHRDIFDRMDVEIIHEEQPLQRLGDDHAGTTRMGSDPAASVVDAVGRTHDLDNLWIAGPSVFPTSGAVLPVLTVVALAIRTGDAIADELSR